MSRKRVLIVHPHVHPAGGGNLVGAWALEALKDTCDLSLATLGEIDFDSVNRNFGTSLAPGQFEVHVAGWKHRALLRLLPTPGALLQACVVMRAAQQLDRRRRFDVLFSTHNEAAFDRPGLQYVHFPWRFLPRPANEMHWYHRLPGTLTAYRSYCARIGRFSNEGIRRNCSLANSAFVAGKIREVHGMDSRILYPPVPGNFPDPPWSERNAGFIGVGRIHGCKRWEMAVEIVDGLRRRGNDVSLTLVGNRDDPDYLKRLTALAASRPWFRLIHDCSRAQLLEELGRHRYGIHTMQDEHFGIAVAELQRAGCVPFVHNTGGPPEIVGDPRLTFSTVADAVGKIDLVLSRPEVEADLRSHVRARREQFTASRFCAELRCIVEEF